MIVGFVTKIGLVGRSLKSGDLQPHFTIQGPMTRTNGLHSGPYQISIRV